MSAGVGVTVEKNVSTVVIGGSKVEIAADGNRVTVYMSERMEIKAPSAGEAPAKATQFNISADCNTVVFNGVSIERAADGHLAITAPGTVITNPQPRCTCKSASGWRHCPVPYHAGSDMAIQQYVGINEDVQH